MSHKGKVTFNEIPEEMRKILQSMEDFLQSSELSTEDLELIRLKSSEIHSCQFCKDMHLKISKEKGIPFEKIEAIKEFQRSDLFNESEKDLLQLTENLAATMTIDLDLQQKIIVEQGKSYLAIALLAISQINTWNRIAKSCF